MVKIIGVVILVYWVVKKLWDSEFRKTFASAVRIAVKTFWWTIEDDIHKARETCPDCENQGHCANTEGCLERES